MICLHLTTFFRAETRDVLKGDNLADYNRSIDDAISFERTTK